MSHQVYHEYYHPPIGCLWKTLYESTRGKRTSMSWFEPTWRGCYVFEMLVHLSFNDNLAGKLNEHDEALLTLLELCSTFR